MGVTSSEQQCQRLKSFLSHQKTKNTRTLMLLSIIMTYRVSLDLGLVLEVCQKFMFKFSKLAMKTNSLVLEITSLLVKVSHLDKVSHLGPIHPLVITFLNLTTTAFPSTFLTAVLAQKMRILLMKILIPHRVGFSVL